MDKCVGDYCDNPVRPGTLGDHEECMLSESLAGRYLYCQACFDETADA